MAVIQGVVAFKSFHPVFPVDFEKRFPQRCRRPAATKRTPSPDEKDAARGFTKTRENQRFSRHFDDFRIGHAKNSVFTGVFKRIPESANRTYGKGI